MAGERKEAPPVIGSEQGGFVSFIDIRVCLECGSPASGRGATHLCQRCKSPNHTRTMLIVSTKRVEGRPVVQVKNFGNHE